MFGKYYKYIMKPINKQAKPPDHQHWLPAAIQTCGFVHKHRLMSAITATI